MAFERKKRIKPLAPRSVAIEKLATDGDGIGIVEGKKWYIPYTQCGDIVTASPLKETKDFVKAKAESFTTYSSERQKPICPLFSQCGGCKLQHLPKAQYQNWKSNQLMDVLKRHHLSVDKLDESCFLPASSRRRVTFSLNSNYKLSFNLYNSHKHIAIEQCPLLRPEINQILMALQKWLNQYGHKLPKKTQIHIAWLNALEVTIIADSFMPHSLLNAMSALQDIKDIHRLCWQSNQETHIIWQKDVLYLNWAGLKIPAAPSSFLQASYEGEVFLQRKLMEYTKGAKSAVDLFCGIGTFSFIMAQNQCKTVAFDNASTSINAAQSALKQLTQLQKFLRFCERDLFRQPLLPSELTYDVVILDPPRAGAKESVEQIARAKNVEKVIMISCNPRSFARDAEILKKAGFYISRLSLLDQFVFSAHSELIAELKR